MLTISKLIVHNNIKRLRKANTFHRLSKIRESPLCMYLGILMHAKTRKKGIIDCFYSLRLSISYTQVHELSSVLANDVLRHHLAKIVC